MLLTSFRDPRVLAQCWHRHFVFKFVQVNKVRFHRVVVHVVRCVAEPMAPFARHQQRIDRILAQLQIRRVFTEVHEFVCIRQFNYSSFW